MPFNQNPSKYTSLSGFFKLKNKTDCDGLYKTSVWRKEGKTSNWYYKQYDFNNYNIPIVPITAYEKEAVCGDFYRFILGKSRAAKYRVVRENESYGVISQHNPQGFEHAAESKRQQRDSLVKEAIESKDFSSINLPENYLKKYRVMPVFIIEEEAKFPYKTILTMNSTKKMCKLTEEEEEAKFLLLDRYPFATSFSYFDGCYVLKQDLSLLSTEDKQFFVKNYIYPLEIKVPKREKDPSKEEEKSFRNNFFENYGAYLVEVPIPAVKPQDVSLSYILQPKFGGCETKMAMSILNEKDDNPANIGFNKSQKTSKIDNEKSLIFHSRPSIKNVFNRQEEKLLKSNNITAVTEFYVCQLRTVLLANDFVLDTILLRHVSNEENCKAIKDLILNQAKDLLGCLQLSERFSEFIKDFCYESLASEFKDFFKHENKHFNDRYHKTMKILNETFDSIVEIFSSTTKPNFSWT